jgi:predicted GNAT superfamily acetyltransferase
MDISDARPMFVVDNLAVNGDYCLFECSVYVNRIIAAARARERERGIARAMGKELVEYIMDNYKTLLDDSSVADEILFAYDDGDSKYGFGICSSL